MSQFCYTRIGLDHFGNVFNRKKMMQIVCQKIRKTMKKKSKYRLFLVMVSSFASTDMDTVYLYRFIKTIQRIKIFTQRLHYSRKEEDFN